MKNPQKTLILKIVCLQAIYISVFLVNTGGEKKKEVERIWRSVSQWTSLAGRQMMPSFLPMTSRAPDVTALVYQHSRPGLVIWLQCPNILLLVSCHYLHVLLRGRNLSFVIDIKSSLSFISARPVKVCRWLSAGELVMVMMGITWKCRLTGSGSFYS